jgi:hypothetical protein
MRYLLLSAALGLGVASTASAQVAAALPPARFGIIAGINLAKLGGEDVDNADNRTGFVGGIVASFPMAPNFAIQPELTFSMKGAKGRDASTDGTFKMNYIELPVLFRFDVPTTGTTKPFLLAGPAIAFQTGCDISGTDQGTTVTLSCKDLSDQFAGGTFDPKSFDVGTMFGGGLAFDAGGRTMTIGVRYNLGLMKTFEDAEIKNRVLSFVGTFEFPMLGR